MENGSTLPSTVTDSVSRRFGRMTMTSHATEALIPGLPDHITADVIAPKLTWRARHIMSTVNRDWLEVLLSRQLYNGRVRSRTTFVLLSFTPPSVTVRVLLLYSLQDGSWIELPKIPSAGGDWGRGFAESPWCSEIVGLNGKIYFLGGGLGCIGEPANNRVYMLDLAGNNLHWKKCASMKEPRASFGCAVCNGKIYVFGGISSLNIISGSEVYNPEDDSWSSVMPMLPFSRFSHRVTTMGDEIIVQGGSLITDRNFYLSRRNLLMCPSFLRQLYGDFMDVYYPGKDEWTTTMPLMRAPLEILFVVEGKLYSMGRSSIHVLTNRDENSWTEVHSFKITLCGEGVIVPTAVVPVNDELVAILATKAGKSITAKDYNYEYLMVRSEGFRKENVEISWQQIEVPDSFNNPCCWYQTRLCSVQI